MSESRLAEYVVSLVVPIYNVEPYVSECIESVIAQSMFDEVQLILVDDGSSDGSAEIASAFASRYDNIVYVRQENRGAGVARNTGVDLAVAPYIAFLDADDILPPESLKQRVSAMKPTVDVVVGDMRTFPVATTWPWSSGVRRGRRILPGVASFPELLSNASPCNKLFRTERLKLRRFPEGVHFEDAFVVVPELLDAAAIAIIPQPVYLYRKRPSVDSIMDGLFTREQNYWDHLKLVQEVLAYAALMMEPRREVARKFAVRSMQGFLLRAPEVLCDDDLERYFSELRETFAEFSVDTLVSGTRDLVHRVAFVAVIVGDFDLFAHRWDRESNLRVINGKDFADIGVEAGEMNPLLRLTRPAAFLEQMSRGIDDEGCVLRGRLVLPGVPAVGVAESTSVSLISNGEAVSTLSKLTIRQAAGVEARNSVFSWECSLDLVKMREGTITLDVRVHTLSGSFAIRLRPTVAMLRRARTIRLDKMYIKPAPIGRTRVAVVVQPLGKLFSKTLWRMRAVRRDFRAWRHHQPLAGWRIVRLLTLGMRFGKPIWLIGERGDTAQDNGYALFSWMIDTAQHVRARYVLDRSSSAWQVVGRRREVVARGGLRHKILMLHAKVLVSSHDIDSYLLPPKWGRSDFRYVLAYRLEQQRVFLQHGVTDKGVGSRLARWVTGVDLFVCSSEHEYKYLRKATDYADELVLTGMPRFDGLTAGSVRKRLLVAPTWRNYLVAPSYREGARDPGTFAGSRYELFYRELLTSQRLRSLLAEHEITLTFLPHAETVEHFRDALSGIEGIEIVGDPGPAFQSYIMSSVCMVTDYSSTMFDAAYAGVPVIQVPFDEDEFFSKHYERGWLASAPHDYWPVVSTIEEVVSTIEAVLEDPAVASTEQLSKVEELFAFHDRDNSKRVFSEIVRVSGSA